MRKQEALRRKRKLEQKMGKIVEQMYDLKLEYDALITDIHKQMLRVAVRQAPPSGSKADE